jgi:hypothetical protein
VVRSINSSNMQFVLYSSNMQFVLYIQLMVWQFTVTPV